MAGSCVTGLAATITYNIYIQGEKTILAASDVELGSGEKYVCPRPSTIALWPP